MRISWMSPPPATPWILRPTINMAMSSAVAHMMDDTKKSATADRRIGLRPQISERLAQMLPLAAFPRR